MTVMHISVEISLWFAGREVLDDYGVLVALFVVLAARHGLYIPEFHLSRFKVPLR
jgi:hypothetical protein